MSESRRKSRRFDSERKSGSNGIPVFDLVDLKKNKDFLKLKQDLEERGRSETKKQKGPKVEVLYVDATRNVGVVLGEKDIGTDMKKQVVTRDGVTVGMSPAEKFITESQYGIKYGQPERALVLVSKGLA